MPVTKRSILVGGARTSISLEQDFWTALREIADDRRISLSELMTEIDRERGVDNLSSATRVHILRVYKLAAQGPASPMSRGRGSRM